MNTQTQEALKMAIELLESPHITEQRINEVVQACKEALEQLAQEPVSKTAERDYNFMRDLAIGTEDILNEMLSAKPIAWTKQSELDKTTTLRNPIVMWKNKYASIENNVPLFTHPAPSWQGLSDDEIEAISDSVRVDGIMTKKPTWYKRFARAIEQALRFKNAIS